MSEKLKKQSVIISLIWAFVGTIGVVYYIKIGTGMDVSPNYANNNERIPAKTAFFFVITLQQ